MAEITRELLRKRAEHNEGMLSTLEEVSLHQQNIKVISGLDIYCRHLKILYFQNNLIEKMEGLSKLKELEYLNLAVNSIKKIEGVRRCESLKKLDMTLNFLDVEDLKESIDELEYCEGLQELFLLGNPCLEWQDCKEYIIARLPQLVRLEGEDITRSQKLAARTKIKKLEDDLEVLAADNRERKELEKKEGKYNPDKYCPETRWRDYVEDKERKEADEKKRNENSMFKDYNDMMEEEKKHVSNPFRLTLTIQKGPPPTHFPDGKIRQCNQGGYEWKIYESPDSMKIIVEIAVPKFMETGSLNVDLQPLYVRCDIKGKIT